MVLLLHWSSLNYVGITKILKKHDKCTGLLLRSPYLRNVLRQVSGELPLPRRGAIASRIRSS